MSARKQGNNQQQVPNALAVGIPKADAEPSPPKLELCNVDTDPIVLLARQKATELQDAAVFGSIEVVQELCNSPRLSMYVDQPLGTVEATALLCAAQAGRADVANVLLEAGASVDLCDSHGRSALMLAAANGETSLLPVLQEWGADRRLRAANGWTALSFACGYGHSEFAGRLLEADVRLGDEQTLQGAQQMMLCVQSALGVAQAREQPEVVALLEALLEQEGTLDVDAALLRAQEAWRAGGRQTRLLMALDDPLPRG